MTIIRDITERKRMGEELQKVQKLESLELFAGGIAHDFGNLLATINGSFYLAKVHIKDEDKVSQLLARGEKAASKKTGNGLGLATAYSIVKKHDGFLAADSQVDVGTTFCLYLPFSRDKILQPVKTA